MRKLLVTLAVLAVVIFAVKKWSPATFDRVASIFQRSDKFVAPQDNTPPLPPPELPPAPKPAVETPTPTPASSHKTVAVDKAAQVVVLCYHRVEGTAGGALSITPELFEQHMQRLKERGIEVISMQDFLAWRRNEKSIPPKSALITLDDGYVSAYEVARPILKKFGYPWTYFIYTKFVASGGKSISWEQLAELRDEGVEIGCHTVSHQNLRETRGKTPDAYDAWLHEEIVGSKQLIEKKLGIRCAVFAYPEGRYTPKVIEVVKSAGYDAAFTVWGQRVTHGVNADKIGRYAWYGKRPQDMEQAFSFNGPISASEEDQPALPEVPATVLLTMPLNGDTISETTPLMKANLGSMGELDASSLTMRLSGVGVVEFKYDAENKTIEGRPKQPLKPGDYTVTVSARSGAKKVDTQWSFKVVPAKGANTGLIGG